MVNRKLLGDVRRLHVEHHGGLERLRFQPFKDCRVLIETERLVLRRFRAGDGADLFAYLHNPSASCFFSMAVPDKAAAEAEALNRAGGEEYVGICRSDTGQLIGDLFAVTEGDTVSVGWHLNPDHGGAGYAIEAATALLDNLFASGRVRRVYAYVEDTNARSQRLCERLGMRREGVFVEFVSFRNDEAGKPIYENTMQYAILGREWQGRQALP